MGTCVLWWVQGSNLQGYYCHSSNTYCLLAVRKQMGNYLAHETQWWSAIRWDCLAFLMNSKNCLISDHDSRKLFVISMAWVVWLILDSYVFLCNTEQCQAQSSRELIYPSGCLFIFNFLRTPQYRHKFPVRLRKILGTLGRTVHKSNAEILHQFH